MRSDQRLSFCLIALGIVALRRQTLLEFPTAAAAASPAEAAPSPADEVARLTELHKSGAITDDEFERAKSALT